MTTTTTNPLAAGFIAQRAEFKTSTGSFHGTGANTLSGMHAGAGILPHPHRAEFFSRLPKAVPHGQPGSIGQPGTICYVVFSYATPIAWYVIDEGWTVPDVKYSRTTSNHQGITRRAVA